MTAAEDAEFEDIDESELRHNPTVKIAEFEGGYVTKMRGKLPSFSIDMKNGYLHGTHIRMQIEVRVKNVRYEELKNRELLRDHILELVSARTVVAIAEEDLKNDDVSGSASAHPVPDEEATAELGIQFRRSSDQWDSNSGPAAGF